jgi:SAM-dependent methyltransferase
MGTRSGSPNPRIAAMVHAALGDVQTELNAGAGSYEPADRYVVAGEPYARMRAQRPATAVPALDATAEQLPFDDGAFDAVMATVTMHQWPDAAAGLAELRRVARGPVVVLTFDGAALERFWLAEYVPELIASRRIAAAEPSVSSEERPSSRWSPWSPSASSGFRLYFTSVPEIEAGGGGSTTSARR